MQLESYNPCAGAAGIANSGGSSGGVDEWRPGIVARLAAGIFGTLAVALVALASFALWQSTPAAAGGNQVAVAAVPGATKEFTLEAKEVDWELLPGTTVKAWTYNGQMPGPEVHVTEGDLVRVTLKNSLPVP